jgi:hypothetical protein
MSASDKLDLLKQEYKLATAARPDYEAAKAELRSYFVELPHNPDLKDISKINKLYATAQSFSSRITTLEVLALDNHMRWNRLVNLMEGYIEDKEYRLLSGDNMSELTNMKAEATVKHSLAKERSTLRKFKDRRDEAASFVKMVETKKKDQTSVLTTLAKQVRALQLEYETLKHA